MPLPQPLALQIQRVLSSLTEVDPLAPAELLDDVDTAILALTQRIEPTADHLDAMLALRLAAAQLAAKLGGEARPELAEVVMAKQKALEALGMLAIELETARPSAAAIERGIVW